MRRWPRARAARQRPRAAGSDGDGAACSSARGVYGFWPAASEGDDIVVYRDRAPERGVDPFQHVAATRRRSPTGSRTSRWRTSWPIAPPGSPSIGAFASPQVLGLTRRPTATSRRATITAILVEGPGGSARRSRFAAYLRTRKEWGLDRGLAQDDILAERHRGIRPGFRVSRMSRSRREVQAASICLDAGAAGIILTENAAMLPATPVSVGCASRTRRRGSATVGRCGAKIRSLATRAARANPSRKWNAGSRIALAYEPARW